MRRRRDSFPLWLAVALVSHGLVAWWPGARAIVRSPALILASPDMIAFEWIETPDPAAAPPPSDPPPAPAPPESRLPSPPPAPAVPEWIAASPAGAAQTPVTIARPRQPMREHAVVESRREPRPVISRTQVGSGSATPRHEERAGAMLARQPTARHAPKPEYPAEARRRRWEGTVEIGVDVSASGGVLSARIIGGSGHEILDRAALATLRRWRFVPARNALGLPVRAPVRIPVRFQLRD